MPLSNVNISLKQFQDISCGKFNAGEVRLRGANGLDKMNDHVDRRGLNQETISHAEVIAIKQSLVKALSQHGVAQDEIDRVRKDLGLAATGPTDRSLRFRSVMPLSRQKVREILDRNAATLNANLPQAERIRTSAEIYGANGMAQDRARKRDAVNQALADGRRKVHEDTGFRCFEAVVSDTVGYADAAERKEMLAIARSQLEALMQKCQCKPSDTETAVAAFSLRDGPSIEMPTGMSQKTFAERLENIIAQLDGQSAPNPAERELHDHYRGLANAEAKRAFLDGLPNDPQFGMKARSLAVQCLFSRGVADYATLAVANRLGDQDALDLAKALLAMDRNAIPEQIRANLVLVAMAAKQPVRVPEANQAYVPALSPGRFNAFVKKTLSRSLEKAPPAFAVLAAATQDIVRTRLGEKGFANGKKLQDLVSTTHLNELLDTGDGAVRVTPETLAGPLLQAALKTAAERVVYRAVTAEFAAAGRDDDGAEGVKTGVCDSHPDLVRRLVEAESPAAADAIVSEFRDAIREAVARRIDAEDARAGVEDRARAGVASLFGLPPRSAVAAGLNFTYLTNKATGLVTEIGRGAKGPLTRAECEKVFHDLVDEHVAALGPRLAATDQLPLPQEMKDGIKVSLLELYKVKDINLGFLADKAAKINTEALDALLRDPAARPTDVFNAMKSVFDAIYAAVNEMLAGKREIGPDDREGAIQIMVHIVAGSRPGLAERLKAFYTRPDVANIIRNRNPANQNDLTLQSMPFEILSPDPAINPYAPFRATIRRHLVVAGREVARFRELGGADRALAAGYHESELPRLARTFALYKEATGCTDEVALRDVLDPDSKPSRLMAHGGRFTASVENFRAGLGLLDRFATWYDQLVADLAARKTDTPTLLNANATRVTANAVRAVEQFLFDEIAVNDAIPLESNDLEDVFGMRGNPAMRFIGLNYMQAMEDTLERIPAEKRALLYAVFDAMTTLRRAPGQVVDETVGLNTTLTARVLKNYDAVAALRDAGNLDRQHIIELLFPDFPIPANATNTQIREIHSDAILKLMRTNPLLMHPVQLMMDSSGDTFEKVLDAVTKGRELPPAPYYSPISITFAEMDGTAEGGRKAMMKDLCRPAAPTLIATGQPATTANRFTIRFPDDTVLHSTTGAEDAPNVIAANKRIADKIEGFCGPVHRRQVGAVFMALSQSGLAPLTRGLVPHGVNSAEHAPVTYTLAKNPIDGAVTITYSEPAGFPFRFHWTVTVALDGTSSSTPMVVEK